MYKLHLILKYLRKRRIAWLSLLAVMLCTAMVLIVISVMGGWLRMFRASFHGLTGDVIVAGESLTGFPYYQEMIDRIQKLPEVAPDSAVPTIETFGLINIRNRIRTGVQVVGYPIDKIGKVNNFPQSLHRQYEVPKERLEKDKELTAEQRKKLQAYVEDPKPSFKLIPGVDYPQWAPPNVGNHAKTWPGMIVGQGVVGIGKDEQGNVQRPEDDVLYSAWVQLTVVPISPGGQLNIKADQHQSWYWIVDDSRTGVYQYDAKAVYVAFDVLQHELDMDAQSYTDADTGKKVVQPARTSAIQVRIKPGFPLKDAKDDIQKIIDEVQSTRDISYEYPIRVMTWEESQATYLNAIENEKSLVTMLFGIISLVAVILILCIFYMIVLEKTKDIGIIKSVGATSMGVAGIFLGYGAAIGVVGAALGFGSGYLIIHYINQIHGKFAELTGHPIWNPEVYAFDTIPNTVNPPEVVVILSVAVVASILGAVVPAVAAARLNPVETLRWE